MEGSVQNEVLLQVAAQVMAQQFEFILERFHQHLLHAQDLYHEGVAEREQEYALAVRLAVPMIPYSASEMETAEQRFQQMSTKFAADSEELLATFHADSEALRGELGQLLHKIADEAKAAERARADELFAVTMVCRREVAATVALVKSEAAATGTEASAMHALQQALDLSAAELATTRALLNSVTEELETLRSKHRVAVDAERVKAHATVSAERDQLAQKLREVMEAAAVERERHMDELAVSHRRSATTEEKLRQQQEETRGELERAHEEVDALRSRELAQQRRHSDEKAELLRRISELEVELHALHMSLLRCDSDSKLRHLEVERLSETKRLLEVSAFKRKLATEGPSPSSSSSIWHPESGRGLSSQESVYMGPPRGASHYEPFSGAAASPRRAGLDSARTTSHEPATARSPSANASPLQLAATHHSPHGSRRGPLTPPSTSGTTTTTGAALVGGLPTYSAVAAPPFRERSISPSAAAAARSPSRSISLRSPSETYMKLQSLSSTWRDKLAATST